MVSNMQYFLKLIIKILKSNIFSGFMGSVIGGIVTWQVTKNSLKKQFQYQNDLMILEQKRKNLGALKSIENEMSYNLLHIGEIEEFLIKQKLESIMFDEFIKFKESNFGILLTMDKWVKYGDQILNMDKLEYIVSLQAFYYSIQFEIVNKMTNLKRIQDLKKDGVKPFKLLENTTLLYIQQNITMDS